MRRFIFAFLALALIFYACKKSTPTSSGNNNGNGNGNNNSSNYAYGWNNKDTASTVPQSVVPVVFGSDHGTLPSSVDLTPYLPPIQNQGQYGTCVAWASAYYTRTATDAIALNYNTTQLNSSNLQYSPKYLFTAIASDKKGDNCNETTLVSALDQMQTNGVATMAVVPYTDLSNCSPSLIQASWSADAQNHKIKDYRSVDQSVQAFKIELDKKNPIIILCKLPDEFMDWNNGASILNGGNYNKYSGPGHALTVVGYDDNRQAFRVANSWGTNWGDQGFIWIDYNYLVNTFCYRGNAYVIDVSYTTNNVPTQNQNAGGTGIDMAAWISSDVSTTATTGYSNTRQIIFDIYNVGTKNAYPSSNWSSYLIYYNAYNANDYGVIFEDDFNETIAQNTYGCTGTTCTFNFPIGAGYKMSDYLSATGTGNGVTENYVVPSTLTGYYYLILMVDPVGKLGELNTDNNLFYTTTDPKYFTNGSSDRTKYQTGIKNFINPIKNPAPSVLRSSHFNTAVNSINKNAYQPSEIISMIKAKIKNGDFSSKLKAIRAQH